MIFYFTGTGNSLYAAKAIADAQGERLVSMAKELDTARVGRTYDIKDGERIGFAFPVYAWAPPKLVLDFIAGMSLSGGKPYVFSVATCGDEEGHTTKVLRKALEARHIGLDAAFTMTMPNNYIISYDVDTDDEVKAKYAAAKDMLSTINAVIAERKRDVFMLKAGPSPALKTAIINPLFERFAMDTKHFSATDACTACGLCQSICPVHSITVTGKPRWTQACAHCLGCIHRCPERAIQYGTSTASKGRYVHPILK